MSGIGAEYSPFSKDKQLLVLNIEVQPGIEKHEHEKALRFAGFKGCCISG